MSSSTDSSPLPEDRTVVVVGAGLAAAHTVATLREGGHRGRLTLVGDEGEVPYERPPLSKGVLAGTKEVGETAVHDADWYAEHSVDLRLGDAATGIDRERQQVTLSSGAVLDYDVLVLATGAAPRTLPVPGADLAGVRTLRTIPDSLALREDFGDHRSLVVVGAGWIGLEAAAARGADLEVTVLEYADTPLRAALGVRLGAHFARLHETHGVDLRTGVAVTGFEGAGGRVTGVRAGDTVHPTQLVVVGVGATPRTHLAEQAGLDVDNGIVVDQHLRTDDPRILAIGDVANAWNTALGGQVRVEHWDNAIRQGRLAARVILGGDDAYDWQPYFFTDQYDLGMEYVGRSDPDDDVVIRGEESSGEFIAFWLRDGLVTAAMNVNVWDVSDALRATVGHRVAPERLADTSVALEDLV